MADKSQYIKIDELWDAMRAYVGACGEKAKILKCHKYPYVSSGNLARYGEVAEESLNRINEKLVDLSLSKISPNIADQMEKILVDCDYNERRWFYRQIDKAKKKHIRMSPIGIFVDWIRKTKGMELRR